MQVFHARLFLGSDFLLFLGNVCQFPVVSILVEWWTPWALWAGMEGAQADGSDHLGRADMGAHLILPLQKYWLFYLLSLFPLILAAHASRSTSGDS